MSKSNLSREVSGLIKGRGIKTKKSEADLLFGSSSDSEVESVKLGQDEQKLADMTELEREAHIFELEQAKQAKKERRELEKRVMKMEKEAAEMDQAGSKSSTFETKLRKMEQLRDSRRKRKAVSDDSDYSISEEEPTDRRFDSYKESKLTSVPSFDNICRALVPRDQIDAYLYHPGFSDLLQGCFARINVGRDKAGNSVYRLCNIARVFEGGKSYKVGRCTTKLRSVLTIGSSEREATLDLISNGKLTLEEYNYWTQEAKTSKIKSINERAVLRKANQLEEFFSKPIDDTEIESIIENKKRSGQVKINVAAEKARLQHELDAAETSNDHARIDAVKNMIALLANDSDRDWVQQYTVTSSAHRKLFTGNPDTSSTRTELDPFSRRKCKPADVTFSDRHVAEEQPAKKQAEPSPALAISGSHESLQAAHDFDLDLSL